MAGARDSYEEAETKMLAAQQRVVALQEQRGVLSAQAEASALMSQISTFEVELQNERLRLQELLQNSNPNSARVSIVRNNISRLEQLVVDLRAKMTEGGDGGSASLARISGELMIAEQDLQTRTLLLQQALQQMETARIEANRQVRYLSLGVSPIAPDEAAYPRALENTFLALLIFGGIYLMLSLTASVLREQVSG
jgi:capsular polysaccharide transport system permease protein